MRYTSRKIKWLLVLVAMLVSVIALTLPGSVCAFGFCENCVAGCRDEDAFNMYTHCRAQGGSAESCHAQAEQYNQSCQAVFCSGCAYVPF